MCALKAKMRNNREYGAKVKQLTVFPTEDLNADQSSRHKPKTRVMPNKAFIRSTVQHGSETCRLGRKDTIKFDI